MTSQDTAWVRLRDGRTAASPVGADTSGHCGGLRRRLDALHEGGVLLDEGRVHFGWVGPSCSTHNPWPVDPRADSGRGRRLTMTTGPQRRRRPGSGAGGPVTEAPGSAARTPDSLLRCPVSTALTLPSLPPKRPAGIVEILRFLSGAQHRCTRDVSTMDTSDPPDLFPPRIVTSRTTSPPKVPTRASASELITPTCLPSEKTAQTTRETNTPLRRRGRRGWCRGWVRSPGTHTGPRRHWGCRCRRRRRRTPCRRRRRRAWRPPAARVRSGGGGSR